MVYCHPPYTWVVYSPIYPKEGVFVFIASLAFSWAEGEGNGWIINLVWSWLIICRTLWHYAGKFKYLAFSLSLYIYIFIFIRIYLYMYFYHTYKYTQRKSFFLKVYQLSPHTQPCLNVLSSTRKKSFAKFNKNGRNEGLSDGHQCQQYAAFLGDHALGCGGWINKITGQKQKTHII